MNAELAEDEFFSSNGIRHLDVFERMSDAIVVNRRVDELDASTN